MVQLDPDRIVQGIFRNLVPEGITIENAIGIVSVTEIVIAKMIVVTKKKIDNMINAIEIAIAKIMVKMIDAIKEKIENTIDIKSVTAIEIVAVIVIAKMMAMMIAVTKKKKEPIKKISSVNSVIGKKADQVTEIVTIAVIKKIEMPIGMITIYANLILIPRGFLLQKKSPKNIEQIMKNLLRVCSASSF